MDNTMIGFIGGGNMARSLIGGLINTGHPGSTLMVFEPDQQKSRYFEQTLGIGISPDNETLVAASGIVVLAVKPQMAQQVLVPLQKSLIESRPLLVSVAAGVREKDLNRWAGSGHAIVRAMPNTPALVGSGATGLYANDATTEAQRNLAESLMRAVGVTVWLERESLLDQVTALSGSGPAYFMLFMEALEQAAIEHGLDSGAARLLVVETCLGAAKLAIESKQDLTELRRHVTSPGGTTESAIQVMENANIQRIIGAAFEAAMRRADELGNQLGDDSSG